MKTLFFLLFFASLSPIFAQSIPPVVVDSRTFFGTNAQRLSYAPFSLPANALWSETDTKAVYLWDGARWRFAYWAPTVTFTVTPTNTNTPTFTPTCNISWTPGCGNQFTPTLSPTPTGTYYTATFSPTPTITPTPPSVGTPTWTNTVVACGTPLGNITPPASGPFSDSMLVSYNAITLSSTAYVDGFKFYGADSTGQCAAALYTSSSSLPQTLLFATPLQNKVTGFQFIPVGSTQVVPAGTYWMAVYVSDGEWEYASGGNTWLDNNNNYFSAYGFPVVASGVATVGNYSIGIYLDTCAAPAATYTPTPTPLPAFSQVGQILVVGDSFGAGVGASATTLGYAYMMINHLQACHPGWTMANYSLSGNTAEGQNPAVFASSPTPGMGPYIGCVIELGVNDIGVANGGGSNGPITSTVAQGVSNSVTLYQNYIYNFCNTFQNSNPTSPIYLCTIQDWSTAGGGGVTTLDPTGSPTPGYSPNYEAIHSAYNDRLYEVAATLPNVFIVDWTSLMYGATYDFGTNVYGHPNNEGHARIGAYIANQIMNLNMNYGQSGILYDWYYNPNNIVNGKAVTSYQNKLSVQQSE